MSCVLYCVMLSKSCLYYLLCKHCVLRAWNSFKSYHKISKINRKSKCFDNFFSPKLFFCKIVLIKDINWLFWTHFKILYAILVFKKPRSTLWNWLWMISCPQDAVQIILSELRRDNPHHCQTMNWLESR